MIKRDIIVQHCSAPEGFYPDGITTRLQHIILLLPQYKGGRHNTREGATIQGMVFL